MSTSYQVIKTSDALRLAVQHLEQHPVIGVDTETTDLDPYSARLRLIQLATPDGVRIVDLDSFGNGNLAGNEALASLKRLLAAPRPIKILHNAKTATFVPISPITVAAAGGRSGHRRCCCWGD